MLSLLFKPGVTEPGGFADRCLKREQERSGWWPFSYRILATLESAYQPENEQLLNRLYASLEAGSGIFKITSRHRFDRLDDRLTSELRIRFESMKSLRIHDGASSNAVTSLDLYQKLIKEFDLHFTASDYFHRLWLVSVGSWTVAFDDAGVPIQFTGPGVVLPVRRRESWRYPVNCCLQRYALTGILPTAQSRLDHFVKGVEPDQSDKDVTSLLLFHPEAVRVALSDSRFELRQQDVFRPLNQRVHVYRIMNFLTHRHIAETEIRRGFSSALQSVVPGGLIVVGRTRDETDRALCVSVYEVIDDFSCRKVWNMDEPWESEPLINEFLKHEAIILE